MVIYMFLKIYLLIACWYTICKFNNSFTLNIGSNINATQNDFKIKTNKDITYNVSNSKNISKIQQIIQQMPFNIKIHIFIII